MKIIGGELKGRNFYLPVHIRPTQNIVREAIFDLIGHDLSGLTFLDLFAGSGAIGFEAISRGASRVTLVESDFKCFEVLQKNVSLLTPNFAFHSHEMQNLPSVPTKSREVNPAIPNKLGIAAQRADFANAKSGLKIMPYENRPVPYELIHNDVFATLKLLSRQKRKFDIIFADPPYGRELAIKTLNSLEAYDILQPNSVIIFQHDKREVLSHQEGRIIIFKQKKYGSCFLSLYEVKSDSAAPEEPSDPL